MDNETCRFLLLFEILAGKAQIFQIFVATNIS